MTHFQLVDGGEASTPGGVGRSLSRYWFGWSLAAFAIGVAAAVGLARVSGGLSLPALVYPPALAGVLLAIGAHVEIQRFKARRGSGRTWVLVSLLALTALLATIAVFCVALSIGAFTPPADMNLN